MWQLQSWHCCLRLHVARCTFAYLTAAAKCMKIIKIIININCTRKYERLNAKKLCLLVILFVACCCCTPMADVVASRFFFSFILLHCCTPLGTLRNFLFATTCQSRTLRFIVMAEMLLGTATRTTVIWLQQLLIMLGQAVAIATATAISYCLARALHINSVDGRIQWTWSTWHTNSKMLNSTTTPADYLVIYLTYYQI